jgi:hypothetical protein
LFAAELVSEGGGRRRPGTASIFPLRFGRQPKLPISRKRTCSAAEFGEFSAINLCLGKIDITHRQIVSLRQFRCELSGQCSNDPFPQSLRRFELGHPKAFGQRNLGLILARAPLRLVNGATHLELPRWTPAEFDDNDLALVASFGSGKRVRRGRLNTRSRAGRTDHAVGNHQARKDEECIAPI